MFYTYLWLREDGTPYYVGKGSGHRAFVSWGHRHPRPKDRSSILIQEFPSERDAFSAEIFLISYYGRKDLGTGCLRNLSDGGENPPSNMGKHHSLETVLKIKASNTGKSRSVETCQRIKESRAKQVNAGGEGPKTAEHIEKLRIASTGKTHTIESRKKISEAALGNKSHLGLKDSAETRAKKSAALRRAYAEGRRGCLKLSV